MGGLQRVATAARGLGLAPSPPQQQPGDGSPSGGGGKRPALSGVKALVAASITFVCALAYRFVDCSQPAGPAAPAYGALAAAAVLTAPRALSVDYAAPANAIVQASEWRIKPQNVLHAPKHLRAWLAANATKPVTLVADAFLADGCVKLISVITCDYPFMNFSFLEPEVLAVYDGAVCAGRAGCDGAEPTLKGMPRRPLTRVLHRDGWNWSPTTVGELCLPELRDAARVDVRLWYGKTARDFVLQRVPREPEHRSEFAMMAMYRGDLWTSPAWFDVWSALGVGHFYIYFNGDLGQMRKESPAVVDMLERHPRVTLHTWPYPMRTVIVDPTGTSKLPEVNKYGKVNCYLHMAKLMAFNSAFHRYGSRHSYMGYFDFDEYIGLPQRFFDDAAAKGTSPLRELRASLKEPDTFLVQNRWFGLFPPPLLRQPLTTGALLDRKLHGGWYTDWSARSKFFVKSSDVGDPDNAPYMVGNHYVCRLRDRDVIGATRATVQYSGRCDQPLDGSPEIARLEPPEHYSLHILNMKPHESLLDFDSELMLQEMVDNRTDVVHIHQLLLRAGFK